jgi:hypothetical protein
MSESVFVEQANRNAIQFLSEYGSESTIAQYRFVIRDYLVAAGVDVGGILAAGVAFFATSGEK